MIGRISISNQLFDNSEDWPDLISTERIVLSLEEYFSLHLIDGSYTSISLLLMDIGAKKPHPTPPHHLPYSYQQTCKQSFFQTSFNLTKFIYKEIIYLKRVSYLESGYVFFSMSGFHSDWKFIMIVSNAFEWIRDNRESDPRSSNNS